MNGRNDYFNSKYKCMCFCGLKDKGLNRILFKYLQFPNNRIYSTVNLKMNFMKQILPIIYKYPIYPW